MNIVRRKNVPWSSSPLYRGGWICAIIILILWYYPMCSRAEVLTSEEDEWIGTFATNFDQSYRNALQNKNVVCLDDNGNELTDSDGRTLYEDNDDILSEVTKEIIVNDDKEFLGKLVNKENAVEILQQYLANQKWNYEDIDGNLCFHDSKRNVIWTEQVTPYEKIYQAWEESLNTETLQDNNVYERLTQIEGKIDNIQRQLKEHLADEPNTPTSSNAEVYPEELLADQLNTLIEIYNYGLWKILLIACSVGFVILIVLCTIQIMLYRRMHQIFERLKKTQEVPELKETLETQATSHKHYLHVLKEIKNVLEKLQEDKLYNIVIQNELEEEIDQPEDVGQIASNQSPNKTISGLTDQGEGVSQKTLDQISQLAKDKPDEEVPELLDIIFFGQFVINYLYPSSDFYFIPKGSNTGSYPLIKDNVITYEMSRDKHLQISFNKTNGKDKLKRICGTAVSSLYKITLDGSEIIDRNSEDMVSIKSQTGVLLKEGNDGLYHICEGEMGILELQSEQSVRYKG